MCSETGYFVNKGNDIDTSIFRTNVILGDTLQEFVSNISSLEKRDCFSRVTSFLESSLTNRVCILYGLRRTGKTTMLKQAILNSPIDKCAYIKAESSDTIDCFNHDLKLLYNQGVKYVFIDEVTAMEDFIGTASLFSDIYASLGLKIVLSGTDSLGFWLAADEELYDRTVMIHKNKAMGCLYDSPPFIFPTPYYRLCRMDW